MEDPGIVVGEVQDPESIVANAKGISRVVKVGKHKTIGCAGAFAHQMSGYIPPFNGLIGVPAFIDREGDQTPIRGMRIGFPVLGQKCNGTSKQQ